MVSGRRGNRDRDRVERDQFPENRNHQAQVARLPDDGPALLEDQRGMVLKAGDRITGGNATANKALAGIGLAALAAGAAFFVARKMGEDEHDGPILSDAPDHVLRGRARKASVNAEDGKALVGQTVTINKPRQELYERWKDFTRFPEFMDNVREVRTMGDGRSQWTIEAPGGTSVELLTRIVEDKPGETIAWVSDPESQVETDGRVEFADAPPGRGTYVRLLLRYKPPAGRIGQAVAKLMQREPNVQARRDLRRFKQLMETGEVTTNASPSGRKSESPTEARI